MAQSYSGSHPDLPGSGITPTSGPDSAKPAFDASSGTTPQISPHEARQAETAGGWPAQPKQTVSDRDLQAEKPRDPMPRLEPHGTVVKQVHAAVQRTRQFRPKAAPQQAAKPAPPAGNFKAVSIGPQSQQERDLAQAMAAYNRMQTMLGNRSNLSEQFSQRRGRGL